MNNVSQFNLRLNEDNTALISFKIPEAVEIVSLTNFNSGKITAITCFNLL